jgi:hypothetical protein
VREHRAGGGRSEPDPGFFVANRRDINGTIRTARCAERKNALCRRRLQVLAMCARRIIRLKSTAKTKASATGSRAMVISIR